MYQVLLFDLDGTLTASGEGITKSVQYALRKLGREADDLKALEVFVGPPLLEQFMRYCGMSEEEAVQGVHYYRERYNVTGLFENHPYEGVEEMLEALREKGYTLGVASSKPDGMVKKILEHFGLEKYFCEIVGSDPNKMKMSKADVIEIILERLGYRDRRAEAVMIGDRNQDVYGAQQAGISCIGVTYGYGSYEELLQAGADKIVKSVKELEEYLLLNGTYHREKRENI